MILEKMKPQLLKISNPADSSFNLFVQETPYFSTPWHYHPEYEIVLVLESTGKRFVGSSITDFKAGDLCMIGSYLPHYYRNDEDFYNKDTKFKARSLVIHFLEDFWGKDFLNLPDLLKIKTLLKKAERGLILKGKTKSAVGALMQKMLHASGSDKILLLLQTLNLIEKSKERSVILPIGFVPLVNEHVEDRINDVYSYTIKNFYKKIDTKEIASIACLSKHSFCRYFKIKTGKTYTNFLHEIRIKHACKLLTESNLSTSQISNECGFVNFANFFRYFKQHTGKTPAEFKKINSESLIIDN
jgi:AraC-like DNA-binding protein